MTTTFPTTKVCYACGDEQPVDQFRLRRAAGSAREGRCRRCYNCSMRHYRHQKRSAALQAFASAVAKEHNFRRIERLCEAMFRRFGGPEGFAAVWSGEIKAAAASGTGKPRAIKAMLAVLNLQALVQLHEPTNPFSELTDDQLREVLEHRMRDLLRDDP